jgi:hypothetical protein
MGRKKRIVYQEFLPFGEGSSDATIFEQNGKRSRLAFLVPALDVVFDGE